MRRLAAVVLLLIAVAVVCFPKVGTDATPDAEVALCAAGIPGAASECAEASHDMFDARDVELVNQHGIHLSGTYPTTTRETRALAGLYEAGNRRDDLSGHQPMKGTINVGVRAGRPRGAYSLT